MTTVSAHFTVPGQSNPPAPGQLARACPACTLPLVSEADAAPWCERCGWGIDVYDPPPHAGWWRRRVGKVTHRIAYRLTMAQFQQLLAGGGLAVVAERPRRWSWARVFAVGFAIVMYAFIAYLAYLGVELIRFDFPNPSLVGGVLLICIAVYLLPRFNRRPKHEEVLTRAQAPTLFGLVDRVAEAVGTKAPTLITVDSWFGASTWDYGLRRRRALSLGVGMFGALQPQQRVALLAHEMGHFRNGDIRRGLVIQPAMTSLGRLADLFRGQPVIDIGPMARARPGSAGGLAVIVEPLVNLVLAVTSSVFFGAQLLVLSVLLRDSQHREFMADRRAAELAGSKAAAELFDLFITDAWSVVASRARAQEQQPGWREAAAALVAPDRVPRLRRLRQLSIRREVSLWNTHPPSGLRASLIEGQPPRLPSLVLTERESGLIDAELGSYYQRARRDLAQSGV